MPYQPWQNPYQPNSPYQPNYMTAGGTYQMMQQPVNGIIKVNGPQSAMQVQLPPNSTSQPMFDASFDGKNGTFYVVSTDWDMAYVMEQQRRLESDYRKLTAKIGKELQ